MAAASDRLNSLERSYSGIRDTAGVRLGGRDLTVSEPVYDDLEADEQPRGMCAAQVVEAEVSGAARGRCCSAGYLCPNGVRHMGRREVAPQWQKGPG